MKDSNEVSNREKAEFEEKLRQSQSKNAVLNKNIKDLNEEVLKLNIIFRILKIKFSFLYNKNRKLQTTIETRDKQYKHERKKLEKEIEKLKERVQLLSTGKTKELPR